MKNILKNPLFWIGFLSIIIILAVSIDILLNTEQIKPIYYIAVCLPSILLFIGIFTNNFRGCKLEKKKHYSKKDDTNG